jgi:hypothetical protein
MAKVNGEQLEQILQLFDDMIVQQRSKCLKIARRLNPHLTPDDLMNSFDWPEVNENPQFVWEDGLLAGLQSAHAAVCAEFNERSPRYEVRRLATGQEADDEKTE